LAGSAAAAAEALLPSSISASIAASSRSSGVTTSSGGPANAAQMNVQHTICSSSNNAAVCEGRDRSCDIKKIIQGESNISGFDIDRRGLRLKGGERGLV
jgi:hypothetical protein